jgi:DNA processing protein
MSTNNNMKKLARAIWYVQLCRSNHVPTLLQHRILRCTDGLDNIYEIDIKQLLERISVFPERCDKCLYRHCSDCCIELSTRENRFVQERSNHFIAEWQRISLRKEAADHALLHQNDHIFPLCVTDHEYPANLGEVRSKPAVIFCSGPGLTAFNQTHLKITVVGTRKPSPYGIKVTELIVEELSPYNVAIISGLARGIDTCAHKTSIKHSCMTIGVTAGSSDIFYPYENKELQTYMSKNSLIVSEHPPGTKPMKQFFPARNRILSGLADIIIVTESPENSGTLITSFFAAEQNREVYAVPGNILQKTSTGCNRLIIDGAVLLDNPRQIIDDFKLVRDSINNHSSLTDKTVSIKEPFSVEEMAILRCLGEQSMDTDILAEKTGIEVNKLMSSLSILELSGEIICRRGRYFLTYCSN